MISASEPGLGAASLMGCGQEALCVSVLEFPLLHPLMDMAVTLSPLSIKGAFPTVRTGAWGQALVGVNLTDNTFLFWPLFH